jgi:hypothetical protein
VRRGAGDLHANREDAFRLHADVQVGGLAGQREVGSQALLDEDVGRAARHVLGLLVGDADEAHPDLVLRGGILERVHHGREGALHVVGAAADEPVAFDARRELALARGHDVEVPVEDDGRGALGPDLGEDHRQVVVLAAVDGDLARLQPTLHEAGCGAQALARRGVVGDQPFGQHALVHGLGRIGQ